jgi:prepilin-type N-terminal cleavage/methylation domain-containing protein
MKLKHNGFSLTEVLMAVGILSMGMMLIATMFPVGIYLTTVATERTMAAIVYDEALAKIKLYGIGTPSFNTGDYEDIPGLIGSNEFSYPSVDPCSTANSQYYWSALYNKLSGNEYQITIFVARKTSPALMYPHPSGSSVRPRLIEIQVNPTASNNELTFDTPGEAKYVNPPAAVLDDATGTIYRVVDRKEVAGSPVVTIDRDWEGAAPNSIWLIPPPEAGGKNAGIEVFPPETMRF